MTKLIKCIIFMILLILIVLLFNIFDIKSYIMKKIYPKKYEQYVYKYSKQYNVDELLIYSIIKAESNFNENAKSTANAIGLMQLMENTAIELTNEINSTSTNLYEPEINIQLGIYYFSTLLEKYNNIGLTLAAYNAGMGRVDKWIEEKTIKLDGSDLENIPFKETNLYVRKILNSYKIYKDLYS